MKFNEFGKIHFLWGGAAWRGVPGNREAGSRGARWPRDRVDAGKRKRAPRRRVVPRRAPRRGDARDAPFLIEKNNDISHFAANGIF